MTGFLLLGFVGAIAHHLGYRHWNGKSTADVSQTWALRYGNACEKVALWALGASVGVAFTQRIWQDLRTSPYSVGAIDSVFSVVHDPTQLRKREVLLKAKIAILVAAVAWALPLAGVITPGTLTTKQTSYASPVIVNMTSFAENGDGGLYKQDAIDTVGTWIIQTPIASMTRISTQVFLANGPVLPPTAPCGQNCTFDLLFFAPSMTCSSLVNQGSTVATSSSAYASEFMGLISDDLYLASANYSTTTMATSLFIAWQGIGAYHLNVIQCDMVNASHRITFDYSLGLPSTSHSVETLSPIAFDFTSGHWTNSTFDPVSQPYMATIDGQNCFAAVFSVVYSFLIFLEGSTSWVQAGGHQAQFNGGTQIQLIGFTGDDGTLPFDTATDGALAFESLMMNFTLSMISFSTTFQNVNGTADRMVSVFAYDAQSLWIAYGAALSCAVVCLLIGLYALTRNGSGADSSFSDILWATRNPTLDGAMWNIPPGQARAERLKTMKLQYGVLKSSGEHAFGVPGELLGTP